MWIVPFISYVFSFLLTLWGVRFYINIFNYPFYTLISLLLAVFIPLSIIFLLPIDYVSSNSTLKAIWFDISDKVVVYLWKSNYWITFLLTWLLLPLLQEFYRSGYYDKMSKFKDALKRNIKFQLTVLAVSVAGVIYLVLEVGGLSFTQLKLMIIAMSHIYSLVLALWLLGHGLVSIPRNKWISGNIMRKLNHQYLQIPKLVDNLEDTKISLKEDIFQILELKKHFTNDSREDIRFRDWILQLYNRIPEDLKDSVETQYAHENENTISRDSITSDYMKKLSASFNQNLYKLVAYESEFDTIFNKVMTLEDVIKSKTTSNLEERNKLVFRNTNRRSLLLPRSNFILYYYVIPLWNRFLSVVLFTMSFIVIESEFFHSTKFSFMNLIIYTTGIKNSDTLKLWISIIIFSYMLIAALNSLTLLKIFNMYHLVSFNSDPVSACFYATYIARLTIPLSYNFITLFISRDSVFESWFGKSIHLTGLFNLMNDWLPRFVLIPVILNIFHVYEKLKRRLGLSSDLYDSWASFDDESNHDPVDLEQLNNKRKDLIIADGKRTIDRELFKRRQHTNNDLRSFNLSNAADLNYENNRRSFHESLTNPSNTSNRIDSVYHDDEDEDQDINNRLDLLNRGFVSSDTENSSVWNKLGGTLSGLKDSVASRFQREQQNNRSGPYTDDISTDENEDDNDDTMVL
ncbi:uncharacterized protein PRCAT00004774001 [Priceomyces carsonii]|uniref:uncharacterized protein n=1 Tax=Priceomyces carsonii TaxID=28549 RepID=UPI002EDB8E9C|nr:unnamed protein product [Priceomyces carsonii]